MGRTPASAGNIYPRSQTGADHLVETDRPAADAMGMGQGWCRS